MAYCAIPGCRKEAVEHGVAWNRYGPLNDGDPAPQGLIETKLVCVEHSAQKVRMKRRFARVGIGSKHSSVLLNLDKRERRFAHS